MERVGPTISEVYLGTRPQSEFNKMADEQNYFDSEAEDSDENKSPGDSDSSEEEEEEEDAAEPPSKDMESFINDESDDGEGVVEGGGQREEPIAEGDAVIMVEGEEERVESEDGMDAKRRKRDYDQLEDEDLMLIAENMGIDYAASKRSRHAHFESDDEEEAAPPPSSSQRGGESDDEARLGAELFGASDEEEEPVEEGEVEGDEALEGGGEAVDSEEEDDFIVDDSGKPIRRKKYRDELSDSALREAQDIFGLDFDPMELDRMMEESYLSSDEEEEEERAQEALSDGEAALDTERLQRKALKMKKKKKKTTVYDIYEPSELERGHLTDKDKMMAMTDLPERFQLRVCPVLEGDEAEWEEEAQWIYDQAFCTTPISQQSHLPQNTGYWDEEPSKPVSCVPKIKGALEFMRKHSFEVPFIATYRRECIDPELSEDDLWKIWQWDEKWTQLRNRKLSMQKLFTKMQSFQYEKIKNNPDTVLSDEVRVLQDEDVQRLLNVQTNEELNDVYRQFLLYYGVDIEALQSSKRGREATQTDGAKRWKHAYKRDFYAICQENGLAGLAVQFGLTAELFGENLRDRYKSHEPEQHPEEPETAAGQYLQLTGHFSTPDAVLHGARHMVAMQIAHEPLVRQAVRQAFRRRAVLHVRPTKKGKKEIDDSHPCFTFKYLKNKPIGTLKDDQFLHIVQAEEDGLLTSSIRIDQEGAYGSPYFEEVKQLFYRDEYSLLVENWNTQRGQALAHSLLKVLYPQLEKEIRMTLIQEAREAVLHAYITKLRSWLTVAPFKPEPVGESWDGTLDEKEEGVRVLACAFEPDKSVPAYFVLVDADGEVKDYVKLNHFMKRQNSRIKQEAESKTEDLETLKKFIQKGKPDRIVVGSRGRDTLNVVDELKAIASAVEREEGMGSISVELMDPNVAEIYAKSTRSREEFPHYPEMLTMAVSLGRRCVDPLLEFVALFASPFDEHQSLRVHPLQATIPKEILHTATERTLVSVVNSVGVDVTECMDHTHWAAALQFVCGLGPRKAAYIVRTLRQEKIPLENRSQLVTVCRIGPKVLLNCSAFIRIDTRIFADSVNTYIEVLDSTRIHMETYEWARKIAIDALEYEELDEANPSGAVEEILDSQERAEKLGDLDLDVFVEELEKQGYGNKKLTVYAIREELYNPFKDKRSTSATLSPVDKFILLTGETPESLHEGKLITCSVAGIVRRRPTPEMIDQVNPEKLADNLWGCPFCLLNEFHNIGEVWQHIDGGGCPGQGIGVRTRLDNGISGFIHIKNLSDKQVKNVEDRVQMGMTVHCRITKVNLDKFSVDLTCRSSDLVDKDKKFMVPKDTYYDTQQEAADLDQEKAAKDKPGTAYANRIIVHPCFKNCSFAEAEKHLAGMDQGEALFRPSSKGVDRLAVTWKVADDIFQHVDIVEKDKPNPFSLGRKLVIDNEEYEDLDEIMARFIQPMASNVRDVANHKYYKPADGGDLNKLTALLAEEKKTQPSKIPYYFSPCKQLRGKFVLAYQPSRKPLWEYFTVTPDGYRFRGQVYDTLDQLLKWFKTHYKDRPPPRAGYGTGHTLQTPMSGPSFGTPQTFGTPMMISPFMQPSPGMNAPYTPSQPVQWGTPGYGTPQGQEAQFGQFRGSGYPAVVGGDRQHSGRGHQHGHRRH